MNAPPAVNATYQWYKDSIAIIGATGSMYTVPRTASSGSYNVRLLFADNCIVSSPVNFNPDAFNALTLGKDTTLCVGEKLVLQANVPNVQYLWQDASKSPTYTVNQAGNYSLTVIDNYGCSSSTSIRVDFKQCTNCPIELPNAFTPNGDGRNDVFKVLTPCSLIDNFYLGIYNRWGQKIFETKEVTVGWDGMLKGQLLALGTYLYSLQYKKYGTYTIVQKRGTFTLLR